MKRSDILRALQRAGLVLDEGGKHTKVYTPDGRFVATVPRHKEIKDFLAKRIAEQTGVKLL
ncbi:type II toxin-antitoxin system HicA family toxin [Nitratidesulfovibrio vulgaris]|uniref:YcfA family protein n=1 Tax=Nitratidesulfovibrio vulgaris (strain ATCC 29579 / DSM 644 / CCUG 34227 / NCIMB 8303 / VKM B-1760 / Hildenborough) TaxID=882 RepID=Q72BZ3_NITV2|nr:type II toxin-antitoxin system HicA family toxin [Nitratidesulfovibrio vulgaris]AAS95969.1 conserved hypothetical protein [Nitratidesulfovibrio vulgaris str. Hildenborough]ADP86954.1 YcfA family protein [Nitratidesulfovibrio vulgaris RCH1]WCB45035.1 type II toxin-antitoxin system HicA family toxin [Nitratidesulfovibrio vulgaris]GEB79218.1 addiction module toxin, HicA family protein [Desulfovibrio desulfuricans]